LLDYNENQKNSITKKMKTEKLIENDDCWELYLFTRYAGDYFHLWDVRKDIKEYERKWDIYLKKG